MDGEPDFEKKSTDSKKICGPVRQHLKKTRIDTQTKFSKVVARPALQYGSETCGDHEMRCD